MESALMDIEPKQQKMTDKAFDHELNELIGKAVTGGIHLTVILGCLQRNIHDVNVWADRNEALLAQIREQAKAKEFVGQALHVVGQNGEVGQQIDALQENIKAGMKDTTTAAPCIAGMLETQSGAAIVVKE
jgi:hypothetical protein